MTLKEKFENIEVVIESRKLRLGFIDEKQKCIDNIIEITESFAVEFADWYEFMLRQTDNLKERFTKNEILEMFKKEKRL